MNFQTLVGDLEANEAFKEFRKNYPEFYLVHVFAMQDKENEGIYQIGYLNPKTDRITTFTVGGDKIAINPESEILKDPEGTIFPLDISKVALTETELLVIVKEYVQKEYPQAHALKRFYILQHLDIGQVFNVTYLTLDFKTLNIKIDSSTGEILTHSLKSLMDFDKGAQKQES